MTTILLDLSKQHPSKQHFSLDFDTYEVFFIYFRSLDLDELSLVLIFPILLSYLDIKCNLLLALNVPFHYTDAQARTIVSREPEGGTLPPSFPGVSPTRGAPSTRRTGVGVAQESPLGLIPADLAAPLHHLSNERNSSRVRWSFLNSPSMVEVVVLELIFWTPRITMHMCLKG